MNLLIADDHLILSESLATYIGRERPEWKITQCDNLAKIEESIKFFEQEEVDVLLTDLYMPGAGSIENINSYLLINKKIKNCCILTGFYNEIDASKVSTSCIKGYISKSVKPKIILPLIELVGAGLLTIVGNDGTLNQKNEYLSADPQADNIKFETIKKITDTERQIITQLSSGLTNKEISSAMGLDASYIKTSIRRIGNKLGATKRAEIVSKFYGHMK